MRRARPGGKPHVEHDVTLGQAVSAAPQETAVPESRGTPVSAGSSVAHSTSQNVVAQSQVPCEVGYQSDPQSTIELTSRARSGDQAALEALCLRCLKSLTRYAAGRLPPAVRGMLETQDLVLEAVQRGMSRLHEFEVRHPGALIGYMRTILRNLIVDHVRTAIRRPQAVSLDDQQADRGQSPLERVLDEEQRELYETALGRLKPRDAALVTLKIEEQLGYDEIAVELGLHSGNAARVAVKRAVVRLAHEMSRLSRTKSDQRAAGSERALMRDAS
jgi:RNA polymerase sigma factor (sigma-70 family)